MEPAWHCPYCGLETDVSAAKIQRAVVAPDVDSTFGSKALVLEVGICPNTYCREVRAAVKQFRVAGGKVQASDEPLRTWPLIPSFEGRGIPDYVPQSVRDEYDQACATRTASPMAAATLARRCLQTMIHDFWDVKEKYLSASIDALGDRIDEETFEAIDAVRRIGKLSTHMEKGTNLLQEATAEEAELLIGLIEYLVDEWYVSRHKRKQRLQRMKDLSPGVSMPPRPAVSQAPAAPSAPRSPAPPPGPGARPPAPPGGAAGGPPPGASAGPPPPPPAASRVPRPPKDG